MPIEAPARNFRDDPATPRLAHYDGYAQGTLPVHGWYWNASGQADVLRVYIDGQYIADAPQGFNRLDVYRTADEVRSPATGFRLDLPYAELPPGKHMVSVTYARGESECLLDERVVEVY